MSIVRLCHATVVAPLAERETLLVRLQGLGCVHVVGFDGSASIEIDARVRAALHYLSTSPRQRHRVRRAADFDPGALIVATEDLRARARALEDERDALQRRLREVAPWGHFDLPDLGGHPELRFWFYCIPSAQVERMAQSGHVWCQVGRTLGERFVVVVSADEPADIPFPRVHFGSRPLAQLEARLAEVEVALDDVEDERVRLTRWSDLFRAHVDRLLDDAARDHAAAALEEREPLALLSGWVPSAERSRLEGWARDAGVALILRDPTLDEEPPTLLANPELIEPGAGLVRFFTTPAYRSWDPSAAVMLSFVLFFAMILGDAVYGAILCVSLALGWRTMGRRPELRRLRTLSVLLALATTVWGVITGSYAGMPPPTALLAGLKFAPAEDHQLMLRISLGIGIGHLILANALAAWALRGSARAFARLGWIAVFLAAPLWLVGHEIAYASGGAGLILVILFTSDKRAIGARLGEGAMSLPRLVGVLGDTLSYLRLFALGIATASLAIAFNQLAGNVTKVPGTGVVLGFVILVCGHGINILLGVAGGVIHGLRLNYIEFFGWGLWGDGQPFQPFQRREQAGQTG